MKTTHPHRFLSTIIPVFLIFAINYPPAGFGYMFENYEAYVSTCDQNSDGQLTKRDKKLVWKAFKRLCRSGQQEGSCDPNNINGKLNRMGFKAVWRACRARDYPPAPHNTDVNTSNDIPNNPDPPPSQQENETSTMTWKLSLRCQPQISIPSTHARFFDLDNNQASSTYFVDGPFLGEYQQTTVNLTCNTGAKVCVGGGDDTWSWQTRYGDLHWGVGINNEYNCSDCCAICGNSTYTYNFTC